MFSFAVLYDVDADSVTEEFTSEWQAEAYRLELQGQAEQALTERAKGLISDFCRSEYGSEADFSDPAKVGVDYTTVTDDEIPVQVNIDLVNFRLERYLDDEHLETRQYGSLQELITNELENLDFSDLIHVSDEDVEQYLWREPEEAVAEAPETAPAPQREPFPYSVGDTVYLENGKPYIIESVGVFDISLSDPTLTPDGNLSLIDDIEGEAAEDKQFIIVQSKNGNYFYIIVDRAAEGENTVHFLNQVDEADLMALMEGDSGKAQAPAVCTCKDKCKAGAVNTACPVCSVNMTECAGKEAVPEPDDAPPEKEKSNAGGLVIFLVVTLLAGGGAFYYFKIMKPKQGIKGDTDLDDFDFDDYGEDEPEAGSEEQEDEE